MFKSKRNIFTLKMLTLDNPLKYFIVFPDKESSTDPKACQLKKGGTAIGTSLTHASALILDLKENNQFYRKFITMDYLRHFCQSLYSFSRSSEYFLSFCIKSSNHTCLLFSSYISVPNSYRSFKTDNSMWASVRSTEKQFINFAMYLCIYSVRETINQNIYLWRCENYSCFQWYVHKGCRTLQ